MKTFDEMQQDFTEIAKAFMRKELGKDFYNGKLQAVMLTTNKVTGKVNIDTCNIFLMGDTKALLQAGLDQLNRSQIANALTSVIRKEIARIKIRQGKVEKKKGGI